MATDRGEIEPAGAVRGFTASSTLIALLVGGLILIMAVVAVPLAKLAHQSLSAQTGSEPAWVMLPMAAVGLVLAWRKPGNSLGWLMLAGAAFLVLSEDASFYTVADYGLRHGRLPLGWVALLVQPGWAPGIALLGLTVLLFPDGRPPAPGWRWVLVAYAAIGGLWVAGAVAVTTLAIVGHQTAVDSGGNLLLLSGTDQAAGWWNVAQNVFLPLLGVCWLGSLAGQLASWGRSSGERRQQLKWLMAGSAAALVGFVASAVLSGGDYFGEGVFALLGLIALPVCIGVAVLKYRLFEIDRIVSRAVAYAIVTGVLIGVYVGCVALLTDVLPLRGAIGTAASVLVAVALFAPLRRRVQAIIDRRFNRSRYDAERVVAEFSARLRDEVELDVLRTDLLRVVERTVAPSGATLWLRSLK